MRLVFDAYDPALRSPNGNYWAWCSTEIAVATADEARALIARHHHCDAPNSLGPDDLHGGCLGLSPTWLVFYRYYNGGRDLVGRPERSILLLAFADRSSAIQNDCSALLDAPPFSDWAQQQPLSGCPEMPAVGDVFASPMPLAQQPLSSADWVARWSRLANLSTQHTPSELWQAACQLPIESRFLLRNQQVSGKNQSSLSVLADQPVSLPSAARALVALPHARQRRPEDSPTPLGFLDRFPRLQLPNPLVLLGIGIVLGLAILSVVLWNHSVDVFGRAGTTDDSRPSAKAQHAGRPHHLAGENETPDTTPKRGTQSRPKIEPLQSQRAVDAEPVPPTIIQPDSPTEDASSPEPR
jgi:hypothetical protein